MLGLIQKSRHCVFLNRYALVKIIPHGPVSTVLAMQVSCAVIEQPSLKHLKNKKLPAKGLISGKWKSPDLSSFSKIHVKCHIQCDTSVIPSLQRQRWETGRRVAGKLCLECSAWAQKQGRLERLYLLKVEELSSENCPLIFTHIMTLTYIDTHRDTTVKIYCIVNFAVIHKLLNTPYPSVFEYVKGPGLVEHSGARL